MTNKIWIPPLHMSRARAITARQRKLARESAVLKKDALTAIRKALSPALFMIQATAAGLNLVRIKTMGLFI